MRKYKQHERAAILNEMGNKQRKPFGDPGGNTHTKLLSIVKIKDIDGKEVLQFTALQSHRPKTYKDWLKILKDQNVFERLQVVAKIMCHGVAIEYNTYISYMEIYEYIRSLYTTRTGMGKQREIIIQKIMEGKFGKENVIEPTRVEDSKGIDLIVNNRYNGQLKKWYIQIKSANFIEFSKKNSPKSIKNLLNKCAYDIAVPILITYDIKSCLCKCYYIQGENEFKEFDLKDWN